LNGSKTLVKSKELVWTYHQNNDSEFIFKTRSGKGVSKLWTYVLDYINATCTFSQPNVHHLRMLTSINAACRHSQS